MTSPHSQTLFDQATEQLRQAQALLEAGQYGACDKIGYQASETIAACYMAHVENAPVSPSEETFRKFVSHIWNIGATPEAAHDIRGVVGDVNVLRESHEWAILDEITKPNAELMLDRVGKMLELVKRGLD